MKIARFIRDLNSEGWWVKAYLFKVIPPMEWMQSACYRRGKLLHDMPHHFPNRMKAMNFSEPARLIYSYGNRYHSTAFVISSAANIYAMMKRSYDEIRQKALIKGDLEALKIFKEGAEDKFEPEVYLFPCDKFGTWKNSGELPGSQRGTLDHTLPFKDMGYQVIGMPEEETEK